MIAGLIDLCLKRRVVVLLLAGVLSVWGAANALNLPLDAFPDTSATQVQVNTTAPALSPLEVERQITFPIEQAMSGLKGLLEVRSTSKFGFSQVTAVFDDDTEVYLARQVVAERLSTVELPHSVERPSLGPVTTALGEVFQYLVESDTLSPEELRTLHHWVIRPQMLQVPGTAEINTWGGFEKQYHVVVDPLLLVKYDLTLDDVASVLSRSNRNVGGGVVEQAGEVQTVQGQGIMSSLEDLRSVVVASQHGTPIYLTDVADVRLGHELRRGSVTADGKGEAVLGLGFMLMGENSREVTARLETRLHEVAEGLTGDVRLTPVYSRMTIVDDVLSTVKKNLLEGALLVVAVLFAFLGNLRAGLIVASAIPLSMLFAANAMLRFGITGSLMSLGAIDFGLIVDSSVIQVENVARHIRTDTSGRPVKDIVRDAVMEVRRPTLFGELIIAIVYLPILTLEGVEGKLFRPMALTVIFALLGSMILSLTVMPALASLALRREKKAHRNIIGQALGKVYRPVLAWALRQRAVVLTIAIVCVAVAGLVSMRLGSEFVPRLQENSIVINTVRLAGVSLDESSRYGTEIERHLLASFPKEVAHVWSRTGAADVATDPMGLEVSDVFMKLTPREQWTRAETQAELVEKMDQALLGLPGMRAIFSQPIEMRVNEMTAGVKSDVAIKIFGDDLTELGRLAETVVQKIEAIPGAEDVVTEQLTGQGMVTVDLDREAAGRYGVSAGEILDVIESLGTRKVGDVAEDQRRFDLVLTIDAAARTSAEQIGQLLVNTEAGARVPLSAVARVNVVEGPASISREWAKRRVTVQANVRERDLSSFVTDVRAALRTVDLPDGYFTAVGGQFENLERAQKRLAIVVPLALLLVFSLLYLTYGRVADALRVFTGVPFGAVGGVLALWLTDQPFSISAAVGFVALSGVAVLGDIVLVSQIVRLRRLGRPPLDAIREAAATRLEPVLMTALVAAFGFVPMALNTGIGAEVQRPLATVVIGGMISSTIATLLVLPVLYAVFSKGDLPPLSVPPPALSPPVGASPDPS